MPVFIPAYWPNWKSSKVVRFDYAAADGSVAPITSVFSYDKASDSMLLDDYDGKTQAWRDRWYYQYRPGFGIAEWRDDYPGKKVVMEPPIGWGNYQEIGGTYINYPKMSLLKSWPPAMSSGVQIVAYEKKLISFKNKSGTYFDVLQMTYLQSWGGKPAIGARYWMAAGLGPVSLQWIAQDPKDISKPLIETARLDATITVLP